VRAAACRLRLSETVVAYLFWAVAALLAYSYIGYPILLAISAMASSARIRRAAPPPADWPRVAVVLSAFNEELHVAERVANLLGQDYDEDKLTVYVGSDGSSDRTPEILAKLRGPRVQTYLFSERRGKATVLNDLLREVTEPITVFTDANVVFERDAVTALVRAMAPTDVGAVCGELVLQGRGADNQDSAYWRVERFLKEAEGRIGALLGANGAIYAIRTALYAPLLADTIIDDFVIAMRIAAGGHGLIYEPAARALEDTPARIEDEFRRRVRIGLGNFQALFRYPEFLYRTLPIRAVAYLSHKVLRWFTPHLLLAAWLSSAVLISRPFYAWMFWLQVMGYTAIAFAAIARKSVQLPRWILGFVLFAGINAAFAIAFCRYLLGDLRGDWSRTERAAR
jgi:cellulose synthase/poly-beta-1,6-N-acetylglucosamine synthase-like glycosyltransferase